MSLRLLSYVLAFPYFELFTSVSRKIKKKYCKSSFNNNNDNKNVIRRINTIKIFIQHVLHFARYPLDLSLNYLLSCTSVFSRGLSISKQTDRGILVRQKRREKEFFTSKRIRRGRYIYIYSWLVDRGRGKGRHYLARIELSWPSFKFVLNSHENSFSNALSRSSRRGSISFPLARSTKSGFEDLRGPFFERQETGIVLSFRGNFCPNEGFLIGLAK